MQGQGQTFTSIDPATGTRVWEGQSASTLQVDNAISSARAAFETWSWTAMEERIEILERFSQLVREKADSLSVSLAKETGKPLWEAKTEVSAVASKVAISIEAEKTRCGISSRDLPNGKSITRHRPHGVCAVFGPFNFPLHIPNGHIVPALLAGNTIVYKPSELTPWVSEIIVSLWEEAGLPEGVMNLLQGGPAVGESLATHSNIDGLFFTGSCKTGRILSEYFGKHPEKILALELGGNNPLVIHEAGDLVAAAHVCIQSAFLTAGQRCTCARRLIIPEAEKELLSLLVEMASQIKISPYTEKPEPFMGPVISEASSQRLLDRQEELLFQGGKPLLESHKLKDGTGLVSPGIIDCTNVEDLKDDEIFGPQLKVIRVPDFDSAIKEAASTRFGLSAGILTDKEEHYRKFFSKVRAGIINWNTPTCGAASTAPFGGIGQSGNHRPSAYYACDYCSYPVASMEVSHLSLPDRLGPGLAMPTVSSGS